MSQEVPNQPPPVPPAIPDHELLRCIGRGSYGEVWLARNVLGEFRAVKIIHRRAFGDNRPFDREFEGIQHYEPISRSHASQVQILHVGRNAAAGYFYYVMELADAAGPASSESVISRSVVSKPDTCAATDSLITDSLITDYSPRTLRSELERHTRLPIPRCVEIGLALTSTLEYLHGRGLVHRDVKPSNIIFVRGRPKLADIGLVTDAGDAASIVGTEGYLAPEGPGSPTADLYSLGKVLYEMSTGRDRRHFPDLPLDLQEWPDRPALLELNEILLKACARDARQRYQSAPEMAADLALLQGGQSVKQRRVRERQLVFAKRAMFATPALVLFAAGAWMLSQKLRLAETSMPSLALQKRLAAHRRSTNAEANMLVEQGYFILNSDTPERLSRALFCCTNALRLDPHFARVYAGLFGIYINDASAHLDDGPVDQMERLRSIARKLLELDDTLPESHYSQSFVQFSSWEFDAALKSVQRALELDPNCANAHNLLGFYLTHLGRPEEGRRAYRRAVALEPANPLFVRHLGHPSYALRQFDQALAQYQAALDLEPRHTLTHYWLGRCYQAKKEFLRAIDEFEAYHLGLGAAPDKTIARLDQLRAAYRERGERGYWTKQREFMEKDDSTNPYEVAKVISHLGPVADVFTWLDKAYEKRERESLEYLLFDECWDPFRADPRFQMLLKRVGYLK